MTINRICIYVDFLIMNAEIALGISLLILEEKF